MTTTTQVSTAGPAALTAAHVCQLNAACAACAAEVNAAADDRYCDVCRFGAVGTCDERCELRTDAVRRFVAGCFDWQRSGLRGVIRRLEDHAGCAVLSVPQGDGRRALFYVAPSGTWTNDPARARIIGGQV